MVVDSSRIRRKFMANCKRARTTFKKAERELEAYESQDKPAFVRWYHSVAGPKISDLKSLTNRIQALYEKMQRLTQFAELTGCRRDEAAQFYETDPQEFERQERYHIERIQREQERREREFEKQREAFGRTIRDEFDAFLEPQAAWIRDVLAGGATAQELFFELLMPFCDETGYFPPDVMLALECEEGAEVLAPYGLADVFDLDDEDLFEPDLDPDDDVFDDVFDSLHNARKQIASESEEARLTALRRELAFALHPDQSDSDSNPAKLELWHQVQEAYEARDLDRIEVLHAHWQMLSGDMDPRTPVSRLQSLTQMYRHSRNALRRRIRSLRKEPDWGFSSLDTDGREKLGRKVKRDLRDQIEERRDDLADLREVYRMHFESPSSRRRQKPRPARHRPDQVEFEFP